MPAHERTVTVPRVVPIGPLRQFVESIGLDPDEVESVRFDTFTVTVVVIADSGEITLTIPVESEHARPV